MGILIVSGFSVLGLIKDKMPVFRVNSFMHEAIQLQLPRYNSESTQTSNFKIK